MIKKDNLKYFVVCSITLLSIRFWSFQAIPDSVYDIIDVLTIISLTAIYIFEKIKQHKTNHLIFGKSIFFFIFLPFVSAIAAYAYHDQSYLSSILALRMNLLWLFYFLLHFYNPSVKRIITLILVIGCVWAVLTIVQQFTYPYYIFYTRSDNEKGSFLRAGIYRFMLYRHHYGLFIVLYFFYQYLAHEKTSSLWYVALGLVGFYFFGTRQFLAVTLILMGLMPLFLKKGKRSIALFSVFLVVGLVIIFANTLFDKILTLTLDDFQEDNIRLMSIDLYLNKYWPDDYFSRVIGNGTNYFANTKYGKEITNFEQELGLYRADIGVIGTYNEFGMIYIVNILVFNFVGIKDKYYTKDTKFLKLFFICSLLLLPLSVYYSNPSAIPFFCLICYLVDKSYYQAKVTYQQKKLSNNKVLS